MEPAPRHWLSLPIDARRANPDAMDLHGDPYYEHVYGEDVRAIVDRHMEAGLVRAEAAAPGARKSRALR